MRGQREEKELTKTERPKDERLRKYTQLKENRVMGKERRERNGNRRTEGRF